MSARSYAQQKAALTRAIKRADKLKEAFPVIDEARKAVREWGNVWPDDWSRWQRAIDDATPYPQQAPRLEELA